VLLSWEKNAFSFLHLFCIQTQPERPKEEEKERERVVSLISCSPMVTQHNKVAS